MTEKTRARLDGLFARFPFLAAGAVDADEFDRAFAAFAPAPSSDYREFVLLFGAATVGPYSVYGIGKASTMGMEEASAIEVTERYRDDGWLGTHNWLVVSADHAGNPIGLDADGRVWISDHDAGEVHAVAVDFESFLRDRCLPKA